MSKEAMTLALEALQFMDSNYISLPQQGMQAIKALEEALAKQEQELALQKLHDENERLGLYKDAYGEEHKEYVRLQCVVCNTVYADGVPPQVAKQEQGEPDEEVLGFNGWGFPIEHPPKPTPATKEQIREALVFNFSLYTTPQQRTWVGLNWSDLPEEWVGNPAFMEGAKWAEAALKGKNI